MRRIACMQSEPAGGRDFFFGTLIAPSFQLFGTASIVPDKDDWLMLPPLPNFIHILA